MGLLQSLVFWFRDQDFGSFQKRAHNRAFVFDVMIRFEVQVLVGVGWFSVHGDMSTAVVIDVYTGVQEGEDPVAFWFGCENNVRVNTVVMSCELLYVVFMDLGERVIRDQGFDLPPIYSEILSVSVTRDRSRQTSGHPAQTIGAVASSNPTKKSLSLQANKDS